MASNLVFLCRNQSIMAGSYYTMMQHWYYNFYVETCKAQEHCKQGCNIDIELHIYDHEECVHNFHIDV
ncbi:hypothetical protein T12_11226 [Trichinella patagoniensis]|uniref:Uncharacterized protein n=1 Tax=Trichinella patagoniensis TaxID=990121 RepID=A0A0V0ZKZ9_9BILA|nr:hypothetical protein T12_11226 [Trichinella patagoniensis]